MIYTLWLSDCRQFATESRRAIFLPLGGEKGNLGQIMGHIGLVADKAAGPIYFKAVTF